ncbi:MULTISPECIES: DNA-deoxyinosine glycosylase [Derxia]|uniref:DNA-deoxyinosine glycosylase n=1 Tax=Derxia gummosa DSM 723 TaxID=1121388 RepID=A0A8B6X7T5_9BURK|nr:MULTISPECIES: DNA-deoxyinosine glycosylase [Derxia]
MKPVSASSSATRLTGLAPVVGPTSRVLILGSFPGAASLAAGQYYAHRQNRFWPIVGEVIGRDLVAMAYADRLAALLDAGLALWDVYAACEREGSLDSAIRLAEPNDFAALRARAPRLARICHNGRTSGKFAEHWRALGFDVRVLPSTSPANASIPHAVKLAAWRDALDLSTLAG